MNDLRSLFEKIHNKDSSLLRILNINLKCKVLDTLMVPITYLGSLTFMCIFCLALLLSKDEFITLYAINCVITLVVGALCTQIIKKIVNRARPFLKIDNLHIKKIGIDKYSFPSGHTCAAFSLAVMTRYFFPTFFTIAISLSTLVGFSRMYLGVHYPTDVLIGMFLGVISSVLVHNFIII